MSSFNKAAKSNQKVHRERSQLASRSHLGMLEKKKDYKQRAKDYQKKQKTLKVLKRRAQERNPDEFYFKMVRTKLVDGEHQTEDTTPQYTEEQLKLMNSQDIKYVNYKRSTEIKKIERLKNSLHMLDQSEKPQNKHTIFCDSKKQAKSFDAAKYFDTNPAMLGRTYNRLRTADISQSKPCNMDDNTLTELAKKTTQKYKELSKRQEREKQLRITAQKMAVKDSLRVSMGMKGGRGVKVCEETKGNAAQYKWEPRRKR